MSKEESVNNDKQFYQVVEGTFRVRVPEGTPDAVVRKLTKGKNAGKEVSERVVPAVYGMIEHVAIEDSEYGKQVKITLDKNEDGKNPVLSFGVESNDGRMVLKKLPGIDFTKEVRVMPYRFVPEGKEEEVSGISISQRGEDEKFSVKIENFFFDGETKQYKHGFPTIDWDSASESEQKIWKIQRDEFLVKYAQEHVLSRFAEKPAEAVKYPENEFRPEDIGF